MAIENFISVPHTEGPKLASALEQHVRDYDVDIMNLQTAVELIPAAAPGGLSQVRLASGASLFARTVVLSTGARWRQMNVPGEAEYRNKGVAYCPHCDGPLFKGKRVAVIGGGNSGVEAAIDLAGIVGPCHADRVRRAIARRRGVAGQAAFAAQRHRHRFGPDQRSAWRRRKGGRLVLQGPGGGASHRVDLDGIFVQIGLVPNTEWLKGAIELSPRGEIEIDARGQTSAPGVFAAGDATTSPYKQIVIAMGDGAKAALSAFDCLIRMPAISEAA